MSQARIALKRPAALLMIAAVFGLIGLLAAQEIIENPAKPLAKDAGRILKLTEVWRITDEGGEFYFKNPRDLRVADDGMIFLADEEQLLKLSPDGRFHKNLYKKGQGPGEIEGGFQYDLYRKDLFIWNFMSRRLWRADLDGAFQEQIKLEKIHYGDLVGALPEGFLLSRTSMPPSSERTGKLMETPQAVILVTREGLEERDVCTFRPRAFLGLNMGMFWDSSIKILSPDRKTIFAYHGRDYLLEAVDVATGKTIKRFRRPYPKFPYVEREWEPEFRKKHGTPKIEFESDISNLFANRDRLWVETSTNDKTKGRLFDVFDEEGRFVDSFHLGPGRRLLAVTDDHIFCQEKKEDESIALVKYRIDK